MCMNRFRLEAVEMPEKSVSGFQNSHTIKRKNFQFSVEFF